MGVEVGWLTQIEGEDKMTISTNRCSRQIPENQQSNRSEVTGHDALMSEVGREALLMTEVILSFRQRCGDLPSHSQAGSQHWTTMG